MDINLVRGLITLALFVLFMVLIYQVFSKKNKRRYEDAANLVFDDGDERSQDVNQNETKVKDHE
ncbi:MAG: cbb3-type cytochrome c oxidase subunit 3 [Kangiellaceae bacterium]|nr:cbb3-type cytochrome c oxidase subunit 3 [Kangiellaceae bacterium]MCW9000451.1 cbb3-type cytochrome c oxidase subunit 3 [Kangiellaceae bacterium]MCW9017815.1 cbb3-type cytochrome c oxidase subunit 3 [Kangiellaceae bacterium]